jgi:hypothetical protein
MPRRSADPTSSPHPSPTSIVAASDHDDLAVHVGGKRCAGLPPHGSHGKRPGQANAACRPLLRGGAALGAGSAGFHPRRGLWAVRRGGRRGQTAVGGLSLSLSRSLTLKDRISQGWHSTVRSDLPIGSYPAGHVPCNITFEVSSAPGDLASAQVIGKGREVGQQIYWPATRQSTTEPVSPTVPPKEIYVNLEAVVAGEVLVALAHAGALDAPVVAHAPGRAHVPRVLRVQPAHPRADHG